MKNFQCFGLLILIGSLSACDSALSLEKDSAAMKTVRVKRGSIAMEVVAVGRLEARFEVPVKASTGGVLTRRFVELGQRVEKGDPICEVRPIFTEMRRLQAERSLLGAREAQESAQEMKTGATLAGRTMRFFQGVNSLERLQQGAQRANTDAEGQLELLLNGQTVIEGKKIDFVIRAPIDGHVISFDVEEGEPVVPSSSYGSGTVLVTLADLDHPVFRGTVDEIDVGRLTEGMPAQLTVGAFPNEKLVATLEEISLKAQSVNNAVSFGVVLESSPPEDFVMRSGYSAVAHIRVEQVSDVLVLPERLLNFSSGEAFVLQATQDGDSEERAVEIGLSNGLLVEIRSGLEEGAEVLERRF